jgi:hypothetical protein
VTLKISPDRKEGPGYAWIDVNAALPREVTFTLSSPNRMQKSYLGAHGWQGNPYAWSPRRVEVTSRGPRLLVGPEIVDRIEEEEWIELRIPVANYVDHGTWPDIPPSGIPGPTIIEDDPQAVYRSRSVADQPPPQRPQQDELLPPVDDPLPPPHPPVDAELQRLAAKRHALAAYALIGFILGGAISCWYVVSASTAAFTGEISNASSDVATAQRVLGGGADQAQPMYQAGMRLLQNGGTARELGLQALHRSAELDHGPALLWLGKTADPSRSEWKNTRLKPDIAVALEAYSRAERAGSGEARQLRTALCRHVQENAAVANADREAARGTCQ